MEGLRKWLLFGLLAIIVDKSLSAVTLEQMNSAGKLMRDVCEPKFSKIPKDVLDNIKNGVIPDDKDVKCYINCVLEMMQAMKKGKFLFDNALKQIDILMPEDYRDEYKDGMTACKNSVDGIKNNCDAAHKLITCLKSNIPRFVFP